ncbi:MAG: hypothetical protein ACOYYS_27955 [Chloroflexota bacterium]
MAFDFDDNERDIPEESRDEQSFDEYGSDSYGDDFGAGERLPEESNNRTFIILGGIIVALIVATMICMGIFAAIRIFPAMNAARANDEATLVARSTQQQEMIEQSLTETAGAPTPTELFPPTPSPSMTPAATKTPLLAPSATSGTPEANSATQTVIALKTQLAAAQLTKFPTPTATSAMPKSGFADDVGAPGLLGLAIVLVVVIFVARRLRSG